MRKLLGVLTVIFREANVNFLESEKRFNNIVNFSQDRIYVGQGFIGTNMKGAPTTLGREGSDYTAAVVGNLLNAEKCNDLERCSGYFEC